MKKLGFIVFCFIPLCSFSQTKEEYSSVMEKFTRYYNNKQSDSIYKYILSMPFWRDVDTYSNERLSMAQEEMGKIVSWKYAGIEGTDIKHRSMALFKVTYSKKSHKSHVHGMEFSLDETGKIFGLGLLTTSPTIRKMLKKAK